MSKSIYEEALEKIDLEFDAWDRAEHFELFELVEHALEQAQKQEKLIELYRELMTVKDELISIAWFDGSCDEMEELEANLEQKIKELEKEIEND